MTTTAKQGSALWAESIVSGRTIEPLVNIRLDDTPIGQFSLEAARQFAGQILEAAEAAESDAFVFKWLTRDILADDKENAELWKKLIDEFKAFREARRDPERTKF